MTPPDIRVVIPWRSGCPYREGALSRVLRWWSDTHPDWPVVCGTDDGGEWSKGLAVARACAPVDSGLVIVSDADVICPGVDDAVRAVAAEGGPRWAMPFRVVYRLTEAASRNVIYHGWMPETPRTRRDIHPYVEELYPGAPGGGMVVLRAETLRQVPIDPRFRGYGQEDHSWSYALHQQAGSPWRGHGPLWHLWHPPQNRLSRGVGSHASLELWHRYRTATTPALMTRLVGEAREERDRLLSPTTDL